jgi:hypothetical protein
LGSVRGSGPKKVEKKRIKGLMEFKRAEKGRDGLKIDK